MKGIRLTNRGRELNGGAGLLLACLLAAPTFALMQRGISPLWIAGYLLVMGALTFLVNASDKHRAEQGRCRIPESTLHFLELIGGWPGAFIAQRQLRHKTSKASYQFTFWLIIFVYQFVAIDSFLDWKFTRIAANYIEHRNNSAP